MTEHPWSTRLARPLVPTLVAALVLSGLGPLAVAAPDRQHVRDVRDEQPQQRDHRGQDNRRYNNRGEAPTVTRAPGEGRRGQADHRTAPVLVAPAMRRDASPRWVDNAHGHNHVYPSAGWVVTAPPPRARQLVWAGVPYWYDTGVWYGHGPRGYTVVRPPRGVVVWDLPSFRSVVLVAGLVYLYANGTYYRERAQGGYEVVDEPTGTVSVAALPALPADKVFIYPRQGQSAQQQANDEFDCHRWAKSQTGFDPAAVATGQAAAGSSNQRADYERARGACLDARGYTVR